MNPEINPIVQLLNSSEAVIREKYGIELYWAEKARLKHYIACCKPLVNKKF